LISDHARFSFVGKSIMACKQKGTLITVAVSAEHEVHPISLKDGHRVLAHLDQFALDIRVV
jgi:hypothetical protein